MAKNTRFMERLFSATEERDEELTSQVAQDINDAAANGEVDTEELNYKGNEDGTVSITDKENGEVTIAEQTADGQYDLYPAEVSEQIEGYLHPEGDGVTPGKQTGTPDEHVEDHEGLENGVAASNPPIYEVEELAKEGPEGEVKEEEEEVMFSVHTDNTCVLKIFSDQEFCERLFSEVIESEETAKVGSLKIEKLPDEENSVIVTDLSSGDQARVSLEDDEMEVEELDSKNFSCGEDCECECEGEECPCEECECDGEVINEEVELGGNQYLPLHVVGVDTNNNQIVDAVEYGEDSANELVEDLAEVGVDGVQVFDNPDAARDYAINLLKGLGVEDGDQVEEPEQVEFSNYENIYVTRFYSNNNTFMQKVFSEGLNEIEASQSAIEDAIENGDEIETDAEIITPVDSCTAVVEDKDNGEYTKVVLDGEDMNLDHITEEEAEDLLKDIAVSEDEVDEDEEEKEFSDIWTNEAEDRFFSENEVMTDYMIRLFSEEADSEEIEDAIESGEQVETDTEVITPVDANTAVIEDKDNGEFTKAVLSDDDIDLSPISEDEADELTDGLAVEDNDEDDEEEEKEFSDIWTNEAETRFFSENEVMTSYMQKIFSEEADQDEVEDAIESGEQVETDTEVITPVDANTAVIEDKETGEFTKATILNDEDMEFEAIEEDEADELTDGLAVEDNDDTENQKHFSDNAMLCKFFNEMYEQKAAQEEVNPGNEEKPSIEQVEDKAQAAIQAIQEMTQEAVQAIEEAKEAPVEGQEEDLREATFSESDNSIIDANNTALSWLQNSLRK